MQRPWSVFPRSVSIHSTQPSLRCLSALAFTSSPSVDNSKQQREDEEEEGGEKQPEGDFLQVEDEFSLVVFDEDGCDHGDGCEQICLRYRHLSERVFVVGADFVDAPR